MTIAERFWRVVTATSLSAGVYPNKAGAFAMSAPAYDQETRDIW